MAWSIHEGDVSGVDLAGLNVAVIVRASDTLALQGLKDARQLKSLVVIDESASEEQRQALLEFAKSQTELSEVNVVKTAPFEMKLDVVELRGRLDVGSFVKMEARKARKGDCICSNESAYYPPLAKLEACVPGVTIEGDIKARSLGRHWSIPDSRTAYLGTFSIPINRVSGVSSRSLELEAPDTKNRNWP